jgi:hypothetical protein
VRATEFVSELRSIPLDKAVYMAAGIGLQGAEKRINSYQVSRSNAGKAYDESNSLIHLVQMYDLSRLEIGMISFSSSIEHQGDLIIIGKFEADFLCISQITKEIVIASFEDYSTIYRCSPNSDLFLEALIAAGRFLERCSVDNELYNNQVLICNQAELCAEIAGGNKYLNFYKTLLGCF